MAIDPSNMDALVNMIVEKVIEKIASYDDEGAAEGLPPGDLGGEQMSAAGMNFLPGMEGGEADYSEDDFDVDEGGEGEEEAVDEGPAFDDEDEEAGDEGEDDGGEEPPPDDEVDDSVEGEDEDESERYMAGDKMIPGKRTVRHEGHCGTEGKAMKKTTKYQADPGDGVALERYEGGAELVRYQRLESENKRLAAELGRERKQREGLAKKFERYAAGYNQLVAEINRRDRADALSALAAEGYELDVEEELARTEKYGADEFDAHLGVIRERYRFSSSDDGFIRTADPYPVDPSVADAQIDPYDFVRYAAENPDLVRGGDPTDKAASAIRAALAARKAKP